jgi:hypothetical protein
VNNPLLVGDATRAAARVALVTCRELPALDSDDQLLIAPLAGLGVMAEPAVWDDPGVDWNAYDLVVIRSAWDYYERRDTFVAWAQGVRRLANPAEVVAWNTEKRYLASLAHNGVPVVPTTWIGSSDGFDPPAGDYVIKPAVSGGSNNTGRYGKADEDLARALVARLQADDRLVMVQPYLPAVDTYGETALLFFASPASGRMEFSHAIRKGAMLSGPYTAVEGLYVPETITARTPTAEELAVAEAALANAPKDLLYARVDVIPGLDGQPVVVELELTEPSVFLAYAPAAADGFAAAIAARLSAP